MQLSLCCSMMSMSDSSSGMATLPESELDGSHLALQYPVAQWQMCVQQYPPQKTKVDGHELLRLHVLVARSGYVVVALFGLV